MADLISRAALLKECAECQKTDPRFEERGWASHFINDAGEPSTEWYCVEDMIENAPAVDAAPVVHGRWVKVSGYVTPGGDPVWKCSECGKGVHVYGIEHGTYGADIADGQWISCPNCGAKMDGERRDDDALSGR